MFEVRYDEALGLVRMSGEGFYSLADEQRAAVGTQAAIARCRALHGDLKVLIACNSLVQDASVMEAASQRKSMLTGARDRVAFLCASSLQKLQATRYFKGEKCQFFLSEQAAVLWLLANRDARAEPTG